MRERQVFTLHSIYQGKKSAAKYGKNASPNEANKKQKARLSNIFPIIVSLPEPVQSQATAFVTTMIGLQYVLLHCKTKIYQNSNPAHLPRSTNWIFVLSCTSDLAKTPYFLNLRVECANATNVTRDILHQNILLKEKWKKHTTGFICNRN